MKTRDHAKHSPEGDLVDFCECCGYELASQDKHHCAECRESIEAENARLRFVAAQPAKAATRPAKRMAS